MSQYDAAATPLWRSFTDTPNESTYNYLPENIDLNDKNIGVSRLSKKSETFNFSKEDEVNEADFNYVLWKGIKGMDSLVPTPRRAAFVKVRKDEDWSKRLL